MYKHLVPSLFPLSSLSLPSLFPLSFLSLPFPFFSLSLPPHSLIPLPPSLHLALHLLSPSRPPSCRRLQMPIPTWNPRRQKILKPQKKTTVNTRISATLNLMTSFDLPTRLPVGWWVYSPSLYHHPLFYFSWWLRDILESLH